MLYVSAAFFLCKNFPELVVTVPCLIKFIEVNFKETIKKKDCVNFTNNQLYCVMLAFDYLTTFAMHKTFKAFDRLSAVKKKPMKLSNLMYFKIKQNNSAPPKALHRNCLLAPLSIIHHHKQMLLQYDMEKLSTSTLMVSYKEWNY